jgi:hypothetical protein
MKLFNNHWKDQGKVRNNTQISLGKNREKQTYREFGVLECRWKKMKKLLAVHPMKMVVDGDDYDDVTCLFRMS